MTNRDKMLKALVDLPEFEPEDDITRTTPAIHLFTPDANADWFLTGKDTSEPQVRYFGMCDLGLGMPEMGWVDHHSLVTVRGKLGLPVELDEYGKYTVADAYTRVGMDVPSYL